MRLSGVTVLLYIFSNGFFTFAQDSTAVIEGELKQWHAISLTFDGPETSENANPNPFLDYRLNVSFSHGDTTYIVPGFYAADGNAAETSAKNGNKWRVYFTPDRQGVWTYQASFRQGNNVAINADTHAGNPISFDGATGTFTIGSNDKVLPDMRAQGRMQYVGEHFLKFAETDEYYIKGGSDSPENFLGYYEFDDTKDHGGNPNDLHTNKTYESQGVIYNYHNDGLHHYDAHLVDWQDGDPIWQGEKGKRIIGAINYLGTESVNVQYMLTNNVGGDGTEVYMWTDYGTRNRYDVSKLAQWEIVFKHMQKKGIVLHFILQETENDELLDGGHLGNNRKLYYRELIARFAHHNAVIWNLGEENTNNHQQRDDFAQFIHNNDPYGHFLTVQTNIGQQNDVYTPFLGKDYFDGAAVQEDYWEVHNETKTWINNSKETGRKWVVFCDEIGPYQSGISPDGPDNNHHTIRHEVLYANLFAGGAGNEWYFGYDLPHNDLDCEDFRSRDRMWDYTRYSVNFWKSFLPLTRMRNANELINRNNAYAFANPGEIYVVYLPHGQETQINLDSLENGYSVRWFDPRNGGYLQQGSLDSIQGPGWVSLGLPPENPNPAEGNDWIAVIGVANMAPVFELSRNQIKLNENFATTEQVHVTPLPVPSDEVNQTVSYSISPTSVSFANITFDTLTGAVEITTVPDQTGSQIFTITADDGQPVNNIYQQTFTLTISPPQLPVAVMQATPLSGVVPLTVNFNGSLSDDPNGPIVNYLWNFGDGETTDTIQTSHIYTEPGNYIASLTVIDQDGMISTKDTLIEVLALSEGILFVVGNTSLGSGDKAVKDSLTSWGYEVQIKNHSTANANDANDVQMVIISSTVNSGIMSGKFANVDVPVMLWEPYMYDDMFMTGGISQTHFGHLPNESIFLIDSAANDIVINVLDTLVATSVPEKIAWARPPATAIPIAHVQADQSQLSAFAYEAGSMMEGMAAPAIRIGMFWQDNTPVNTTTEGWNLFQQLVCWATNCGADTTTIPTIQLASISDQLNEQLDTVSLQLAIENPTDSLYNFEIIGLPEGLSYDTLSGLISGNIADSVGVYPVSVYVSDRDTLTEDAFASFNWIVFTPKPNLPPELAFVYDQLNEQGDIVSLQLMGTDIDGDSLYYVATGLPLGLVADSVSGEIYGVIADSAGIYQVRADVWDHGEPSENAYIHFLWEVIPPIPNQAPALANIADQSFEEGETVNIELFAVDIDEEDSLFYAASGLPSGLYLDILQGTISGQLADNVGNYPISVIVYDNGIPVESDTVQFTLTITLKALEALLLVGELPMNNGDAAIERGMRYLGYQVEVMLDNQSQTNAALDKELIFISSTVSSWAIADKFTQVNVPIICSEAYLFDDLKMVGSTASLGNIGGQSSITISDTGHQASAGFNGLVSTTVITQEKSWGTPNNNGKIIANLNVDSHKATIFSYETGSQMYGLNAPARRMGFFLRDEAAAFLTDEGWTLFDAAVCWAGGCRLGIAREGSENIEMEINIFPNPVSDLLHIELPSATFTQVRLYDLMGKKWMELEDSSYKIALDMDELPQGIYILQVRQGSILENVKVVKH